MAKIKVKPQSFSFAKDDPLASEHAAVAGWIEDACSWLGRDQYYQQVDLKDLPSGKRLFDAKGEQARRYVAAAVVQTRYWDQLADRVRDQAENELQRINAHHLPGWAEVWGRRRQAEMVVSTLMRRKLPLTRQDVLDVLAWCNESDSISLNHFPLTYISRALERFVESEQVDDELRAAMQQFAVRLRASHDKQASRLGTTVEQLCAVEGQAVDDESPPETLLPPPEPAPAGQPRVLVQLKKVFGMTSGEAEEAETVVIGPDQFPLADDSPLKAEHELLTELFEEVIGTPGYYHPQLESFSAGQALLQQEPEAAGRVLLAAAERHVHALLSPSTDYSHAGSWQSRYAAAGIVIPLARVRFSLSREGTFDLLLYLAARPAHERLGVETVIAELIALVERDAQSAALSEGERYVLSLARASLVSGPALGNPSPRVARLTRLIGDSANFCLEPGEVWAEAVNEDFTAMTPAERRAWSALFAHLLTATSSRPSKKWLKTAGQLVDDVGGDKVQKQLDRWLPRVAQGRSIGRLGSYVGDARGAADTMNEENATCLRGLLWLIPALAGANDLVHQVAAVAMSAYKKVPGVGPRAVKVGNAAVYVLSQLAAEDAVG